MTQKELSLNVKGESLFILKKTTTPKFGERWFFKSVKTVQNPKGDMTFRSGFKTTLQETYETALKLAAKAGWINLAELTSEDLDLVEITRPVAPRRGQFARHDLVATLAEKTAVVLGEVCEEEAPQA